MSIAIPVVAALVLAAALFLVLRLRGKGLRIRITKAELQRQADQAMPVRGPLVGIDYAVERVALDPRPDGRIGFAADLGGKAMGVGFGLTLAGSGALRYRSGSFYLADFKVEQVGQPKKPDAPAEAQAVPAEASGLWSAVTGFAGKAWDAAAPAVAATRERGEAILAQAIEHIPVYTLDGSDVRESLARLVLRDVKVVDGAIVAELGRPDAPARTA